MATDPNLVTAESAVKPSSKPEPAPIPTVAGQVLKRGGPPPEPVPTSAQEGLATVRITKKGHGKVHTGIDRKEDGPEFYDWNDEVALPRTVALLIEDRGYAEIQD